MRITDTAHCSGLPTKESFRCNDEISASAPPSLGPSQVSPEQLASPKTGGPEDRGSCREQGRLERSLAETVTKPFENRRSSAKSRPINPRLIRQPWLLATVAEQSAQSSGTVNSTVFVSANKRRGTETGTLCFYLRLGRKNRSNKELK